MNIPRWTQSEINQLVIDFLHRNNGQFDSFYFMVGKAVGNGGMLVEDAYRIENAMRSMV